MSESATRYSLADVRRSYSPEKAWGELQGDLVCSQIYRPISFYVSWALLRIGIPLFAITTFSAVLAFAMLAVAWLGGPNAHWVVCGLGILYPILDCADGNMARTAGTTSRLGGIVDGTVDMFYICIVLVSLGLLTAHAGGGLFGDHAVEFSLVLVGLLLLNRQTRDNYAANFSEATYFTKTRPERLSFRDRLLIAVVGLEHGYVWAVGIGGSFGVLDLVLLGVGIYTGLIFIGALAMTFAQAAAADRRGDG